MEKNILLLKTSLLVSFILLFYSNVYSQSPSIGGYKVYYGHLHNHTSYSDGQGTPAQAYAAAKTAGLDFFGLADHSDINSNLLTSTEWNDIRNQANAYYVPGSFVTFYGYEWSSGSNGHITVTNDGVHDTAYSNVTTVSLSNGGTLCSTFSALTTFLSTRNLIAFFNHPTFQDNNGTNSYASSSVTVSAKLVGMERWNINHSITFASSQADYNTALTHGWKVGTSGSADNHNATWGTITVNRLAILADTLTRESLFAAMQARRFYSTLDSNLALSFKINRNEMGSEIPAGTDTIHIQAYDGGGSGDLFKRLALYKNGSVLYAWNYSSGTANVDETYYLSSAAGDYYYVKVVQQDSTATGGQAISSPIFISTAVLPGAAGTITGTNPVCPGQTGVTYTVPAITNATSYIWTLPSGATGTSSTNSITIDFGSSAVSGNITVKGHNSSGDGASSSLTITVNSLAGSAGTISGPVSVCQGESSVVYSVPAIANATAYVWTLPTGATGTSTTNSITVDFSASAVSGDITVKGTNSCGDGVPSSLSVVLMNVLPDDAGAVSGPATVCQGQSSLTYTVPTIANAASYVWTFPTGATGSGTTNSITIDYGISAVSGNIIVKGQNGCGTGNESSFAVTVNPLPESAGIISGSASFCPGQSAVTYSVPVIANSTSYIWTLPSGVTGSSNSESITVDYSISAVSGDIIVTGNNSCGSGIPSTLAVTVSPLPVSAGPVSGTSSVCQGQSSVAYSVPAIANATSYEWTLPTGATGTSTTSTINVDYSSSAVSGDITVKGINSCGDGIPSVLAITVNNAAPSAAGTISGTETVCQGESLLSYTVPAIANATSYLWSLPSGVTGVSNSNTIVTDFGTSAVSGDITVTGQNGCGTGSESSLSITVNTMPGTAIANASQSFCGSGTIADLNAAAGTNGDIVAWFAASGGGTPLVSTTTLVNGTSYYAETQNSVTGCVASSRTAVSVTINPIPGAATASASQNFCGSGTIAGLSAAAGSNGNIVAWFAASVGGTALVSSNPLVDGTTYYVESQNSGTGCIASSRTAVLVTINPVPGAATAVANQSFCGSGTVANLNATTGLNGNTVAWFAASVGGTALPSSATLVNGTTYYAESQNNINPCVSATRTPVVVAINPNPGAATAAASQGLCGNGTIANLSATVGTNGNVVFWFDASVGGTALPSSTSLIDGTTYYAESQNSNTGCVASLRTAVLVAINAIPGAATAAANQGFCSSGTIAGLSAAAGIGGNTVVWFAAASGGTALSSSTSLVSGNIYYAESLNSNTGCIASSRTAVTVSINPIPGTATASANQNFCGGTVADLGATAGTNGNTVIWYAAPGGGTALPLSTSLFNGTTYYAESQNSNTGCISSSRAAVEVAIIPLPGAAIANASQSFCGSGTIASLNATVGSNGDNIAWYAVPIGGSTLASSASLVDGAIYYAETQNSSTECVALSRTAVTVTINPVPGDATAAASQGFCGSGTLSDMIVTGGTNSNIVAWYAVSVGGNALPSSTSLVGGTTYYAESQNSNTGCVSSSRTAVVVTIYPLPGEAIAAASQSFCGGTVADLAATAGTNSNMVAWFSSSTGGTALLSSASLIDGNTYYAESQNSVSGCAALSRTAVVVSIIPLPGAAIANANQGFCGSGTIADLMASPGSNGDLITWYITPAGGNTLASTTPLIDGTTYYAESQNSSTECVSSSRTGILVTIFPLPGSAVAPASQSFCGSGTIADISAAPGSNSDMIAWYETASGGSTLAPNTILTDGTTYYAESQNSVTECIASSRSAVIVIINLLPDAATVDANQDFCESGILADVNAVAGLNGNIIEWYASSGGGNILPLSTPLVDGISYYAETQNSITGCIAPMRTAVQITLNPLPDASISSDGPATFCEGGSINLCAGNGYQYFWSNGTTGQCINVNSSGNSSVIVTDGNNCSNVSAPFQIVVNPLPSAAGIISGDAAICQGQTAVIYSVPEIADATSYAWTLPQGVTGTSSTNSITVDYGTDAVSGDIIAAGNNSCGDGVISILAVMVDQIPAGAGSITGATTVCQGQTSVSYSVSPIAGAESYTWTLPPGATGTSSGSSITVDYGPSAVSGDIFVNGNSSCGNGAPSVLNITIGPMPAGAGTIIGTTTVCQGQTSVSYTVSPIAGATSYTWTLPAGVTGTSTINSIMVDYTTSAFSGDITVQGTNSCGDGAVSALPVVVNTTPAIPVITLNGNTLYSDAAIGNQWYDQNGAISGAVSQSYLPLITGDYFVLVSENGCTSDTSNIIHVLITGIAENTATSKEIVLQPNPATEKITIGISCSFFEPNSMLYIYDIHGKLVINQAINKITTELNISGIAKGFYFIKVENNGGIVFNKFTKE